MISNIGSAKSGWVLGKLFQRRRGRPALFFIRLHQGREYAEAFAVDRAVRRAPQFFDLAQGGLMITFGLDWVKGHHEKQIRGIRFHAKAQRRKESGKLPTLV